MRPAVPIRAVAVAVGLGTAIWTGAVAGPAGRALAVAAGIAVAAGVRWRPAATVAGCLLVAVAAVDDLTAPRGLDPVSLALAAVLLTLYLALVDAATIGPRDWLVPAASILAGIAVTILAIRLPAPAWMAPVGMGAAATAFILAASSLWPPAVKRAPGGPQEDSR
jgi:hypothetical protein